MSAKYRINVARRSTRDAGYDREPYVATAWSDIRCVAVQFGAIPGHAFQKAWDIVQQDRERDGVTSDVNTDDV